MEFLVNFNMKLVIVKKRGNGIGKAKEKGRRIFQMMLLLPEKVEQRPGKTEEYVRH